MHSAGNFIIGALKGLAVMILGAVLLAGSILVFDFAERTAGDFMYLVVVAIGIVCAYLAITYNWTRGSLAQVVGGAVAPLLVAGAFAGAYTLQNSPLSEYWERPRNYEQHNVARPVGKIDLLVVTECKQICIRALFGRFANAVGVLAPRQPGDSAPVVSETYRLYSGEQCIKDKSGIALELRKLGFFDRCILSDKTSRAVPAAIWLRSRDDQVPGGLNSKYGKVAARYSQNDMQILAAQRIGPTAAQPELARWQYNPKLRENSDVLSRFLASLTGVEEARTDELASGHSTPERVETLQRAASYLQYDIDAMIDYIKAGSEPDDRWMVGPDNGLVVREIAASICAREKTEDDRTFCAIYYNSRLREVMDCRKHVEVSIDEFIEIQAKRKEAPPGKVRESCTAARLPTS